MSWAHPRIGFPHSVTKVARGLLPSGTPHGHQQCGHELQFSGLPHPSWLHCQRLFLSVTQLWLQGLHPSSQTLPSVDKTAVSGLHYCLSCSVHQDTHHAISALQEAVQASRAHLAPRCPSLGSPKVAGGGGASTTGTPLSHSCRGRGLQPSGTPPPPFHASVTIET